jgi:hypothetical protein
MNISSGTGVATFDECMVIPVALVPLMALLGTPFVTLGAIGERR